MSFAKLLSAFASLRLTVALLAFAMVLIFAGTLAQAQAGVWEVVDGYFRSPIAWIDLQLFIPRQMGRVPVAIPFPGGLMLGVLLCLNLVAAHAVRFRMVAQRVGIVVVHAGLIVLLLGEFATGIWAEEGLMSIDEGGSARFVEDVREVELAVLDRSDPKETRVAAVPESLLLEAARSGDAIEPLTMPFRVTVDRWLANAQLVVAPGEGPPTQGVGLEAAPRELPRARGVEGAQTNAPAAYVTLRRDGMELGTWLLWANLVEPQTVEAEGKEYALALRYQRHYKPFTIHLLDFSHDKYAGTEVAKNFSSRVRLVDPERGTDREVLISMNNPLRYRGETFYQASYKPDGSGTILQVVRNPGALLPYIACAMVGGGLLLHFTLSLLRFLRRQRSPARAEAPGPGMSQEGWSSPLIPWGAAVVAVVLACSGLLRREGKSEFDLRTFGALPVSSMGRVKPLDSAARHVLKVAGGREAVRMEGGRMSAVEFAARLIGNPDSVRDLRVLRVVHPDVLGLLGLPPEAAGRIALDAVEPHWEEVLAQAERASQVPTRQRDLYQRSILQLHERVSTILSTSSMVEPLLIPPLEAGEEWRSFHDAYLEARAEGAERMEDLSPALTYYIAMMTAYSEGDASLFNRTVGSYHQLAREAMPREARKAELEVLFNRATPFLGTMVVYVLAFLALCAALLLRARGTASSETLRQAAVGLLWGGLLVHTVAIAARIWLQDRPPVTNLYSSAVFVGWAAVLTALLLERLHRLGLAAVGAAAVGFATLVVAHNLGNEGETMPVMQAVLDSNFWLATHVVTITLGYSATFLAGALATLYVVLGVFTRLLTADRAAALGRMVYGSVCFALLLSFVGTVLGGIWADQSWGRFWGWDPKENGAALVVLINAIILHARWGKILRARGIMALAIFGNIVTAWSWFGTNMLGVGLHSYGFMDSAVFWLLAFVATQLILIAIGLAPLVAWRSFGHMQTQEPAAPNASPSRSL